jgi:hypothetical protein
MGIRPPDGFAHAPNAAGAVVGEMHHRLQATGDMTQRYDKGGVAHIFEVQIKSASGQNAFVVSIADWDAATHMSKQGWRNASALCEGGSNSVPLTHWHRLARSLREGFVSDRHCFSEDGLWGP